MFASPDVPASVTLALCAFATAYQKTKGSLARAAGVAAALIFSGAACALAQPSAAGSKPATLPVATMAQFDQAMEVAMLAAEHDLQALSLHAVREALRPGPPAVPMKAMTRSATRVVRSSRTNQPDGDASQIAQRVEQRLSRLNALWKSHSAPPEAVYEALASAVLPAGRPIRSTATASATDRGWCPTPTAR